MNHVTLKHLDTLDVEQKTVLCRVDLNVPIKHGKIQDFTRITAILPTIHYLKKRHAKIVLLSHFGRPQGAFAPEYSLAPIVDALEQYLPDTMIKFSVDCVGTPAEHAVAELKPSEVLLLENLRFHAEEKENDPNFSRRLAALGDCYVNDAFSCSHRNHASIVGLPKLLPHAAGLGLLQEIQALTTLLHPPKTPLISLVGGAKISTKLSLLDHLITLSSTLVVGGAMANTLLYAQGYAIGTSMYEESLVEEATQLLDYARKHNCTLILPLDAITTTSLVAPIKCAIHPITTIPNNQMMVDIGPQTVHAIHEALTKSSTALWNGPLGVYETPPLNIGTESVARSIASLTEQGLLKSIAGGGDVLAALHHSGLKQHFTHISTGGGAFLSWLEQGTSLPGINMLS